MAIIAPKSAQNLYTLATLRTLCRHCGVTEVEESAADALWVSVCDPDDLPTLQNARALARGRPVVMGGFDAWFGVPYLAWSDAVVVGEGLDFISAWGRSGYGALDIPCVLTAERYRGGVVVAPSYSVPWRDAPLLRLPGKERYYYLAGKGCKGKCRFCATSWTQPWAKCPQATIGKVVRYVERRGGKLNLISNDSDSVTLSPSVNAQSVRVVDYLADPGRYKASMLHFGIEFWDEKTRASNGKPITDAALSELLRVTKTNRQKCELFFIVGYAGWSIESVEDFAARVVEPSTDTSPAVHVKCTYLDPCPHTPIAGDKVEPNYCDTKAVFRALNSRNKRIRVFPTRSAGRSAWRTALHRCTPEEALALGPEPDGKNEAGSFGRFRARLDSQGLGHLLDGSRRLNEASMRTRIK